MQIKESGRIDQTGSSAVLSLYSDPPNYMGVERLIIAGFATDECIEATGRAAMDLGYVPFFAEDACAAYEASAHEAFMGKYASWGLTRPTAWLQKKLASLK